MFGEMLWIWVGFIAFVLAMLALDLGVFHRDAHEVSMREAATWTVVWVSLALIFCGVVWWWKGGAVALQFLTGYLIEESLSVDNIFVFVLILTTFGVPAKYQHRVLFWGILGALVMRGVMIGVGAALIHRFHWVIYLFGAFLLFTGIKMFVLRNSEMDPARNPVLRLVRRIFPVTEQFHDEKFFVRHAGKLMATPLFLVLVLLETTDLIFAVDSIPAIFAITEDPFIIFTSNIFAILGLRSLYFLLAGAVTKFHYLKPALSAILVFVGSKMLLSEVYKIPIGLSLAVIGGILGLAIVASWWRQRHPLGVR